MSIDSKEDAAHVARSVIERSNEMDALVEKLKAEGWLGFECPETVRVEKLAAENASAARVLAAWIVKEHG